MPTLKVWTATVAFCILATTGCVHGQSAAGVEEPAYRDEEPMYRDGFETPDPQALVLDAVNRVSGIRIAAAESWELHRQLPASLAPLGVADPYPAGSAWATLESGVLMLRFEGELAGETLAFAAWDQADEPRWTCGNAPPPLDATLVSSSNAPGHTSLPDTLLPDACRSAPSATVLVDEAWIATAQARTTVEHYWSTVGGPPADLAEVGLDDPLPVARAWLQLDDGVLVATFVDPLAGETLAMSMWSQAGPRGWVCGHAPVPVDATLQSGSTSVAQTSLPEALLPERCRSDLSPAMQVQDVLRGANWARVVIAEDWMLDGTLPATLAEVGLPDPQPFGQARLQLVEGVLVAIFVGDLEGKRLALAPWNLAGEIRWVCGHRQPPLGATAIASGTASAQTTLEAALLPESCR